MRWGFTQEQLSPAQISKLQELATEAKGDILKMTTVAGSGHPGGSMSSIDMYLVLYFCADVFPDNPNHPERDRIVVSHGHTSPGVYSALAFAGFFPRDAVISGFRKTGSIFEGHIERDVPGVEWSTGNLGQGLSAGCGFCLATKIRRNRSQVFVVMGDGEQAKGQVGEARRFARRHNLNNLTALVDYNGIQLSGPLKEILPQNIKEGYRSDGWAVLEVDGHDHQAIYQALREAVHTADRPVMILARTTMSKGVGFMEDKYQYHGSPLSVDECRKALQELGVEDDLERYQQMRNTVQTSQYQRPEQDADICVDTGIPFTYQPSDKIDNRGAFGKALCDLGSRNAEAEGKSRIAVLDCDLLGSVKTEAFAQSCPTFFFQGGIQEHNAATTAGALSADGIVTFFADFGVFGVDETYNQHRLNDINRTNLKLVCTHNGLDLGQDGKTHQCIDYIGAMRNLFGYRIIVPADPNQTDRVVRFLATRPGNFILAVGRSKIPPVTDENGGPFFGNAYAFEYGKADLVRSGDEAAIVTCGTMTHLAVAAHDLLREQGHAVQVVNVACLSDLDEEALRNAADTGVVVTYEDHNVRTGLGSVVAEFLADNSLSPRFRRLGVSRYGGSGKPSELFAQQGLDAESVAAQVKDLIERG